MCEPQYFAVDVRERTAKRWASYSKHESMSHVASTNWQEADVGKERCAGVGEVSALVSETEVESGKAEEEGRRALESERESEKKSECEDQVQWDWREEER